MKAENIWSENEEEKKTGITLNLMLNNQIEQPDQSVPHPLIIVARL